MYYINDRTGEEITKLFEEKKLNIKEYFDIMDCLSMDIFEDAGKWSLKLFDVVENLHNSDNELRAKLYLETSHSISMDIKRLLIKDYYHKLADIIHLSRSTPTVNNKKFLYAVIKKIDEFEKDGCEFDRKKLDMIEKQFERV